MSGNRHIKGHPDREICNLFAALNQEQQRDKSDISGIYEGRLRSHAQNFEGLKRKWEGFTGVPVPKKLRSSEADYLAPAKKENKINLPRVAESDREPMTVKKSTATVPVKTVAPAAKMPSHPDDKINVDRMLVSDLRKELRKKGLSYRGLKVDLQATLRQYLAEAKKKREAEWVAKQNAAKRKATTQMKQAKIGNHGGKNGISSNHVKEMDAVMEDASEADVSMNIESDKVKIVKKAPMEKMASSTKLAKESATVGAMKNNLTKNQAPKSALKPSKYASSTVQSAAQLDDLMPAVKPAPTSLAKEHLSAHKQSMPTKVSDSSSESSCDDAAAPTAATTSKAFQASLQKAKISSTLAHTPTVPGGSAFKAKVGGAGSAKLLEKKKAHAAATEARKARMAEMRQKAKPNATSSISSATKLPPSHSKYAVSSTLKKMATGSTLGESKPNSILAKMREKAAAEKNTDNHPPSRPAPEAVVQKSSMMLSSSTANRVSQVTTSKPSPIPTALKSLPDPGNKPTIVLEETMKSELPEEGPLSPMQTYEMSDREEESSESESESDDDSERQRPKKSIPEWAQKVNLHRALERQFADGPDRLDPDKIFGEVVTCNLEEIFDKKKSRYQRRTSSGNWTKDHVTLAEKLTYKRTMGYDRK